MGIYVHNYVVNVNIVHALELFDLAVFKVNCSSVYNIFNIEFFFQRRLYDTVSPKKHGNSVTIFTLSTSAHLGSKIYVGCVPASGGKVNSNVFRT